MAHRTTILLDDEARQAATDLANRLQVSTSEAIRRAIVRYRDMLAGVPPEARQRRKAAFARLIELFEGHDAEAEIRRIKAEDQGF